METELNSKIVEFVKYFYGWVWFCMYVFIYFQGFSFSDELAIELKEKGKLKSWIMIVILYIHPIIPSLTSVRI